MRSLRASRLFAALLMAVLATPVPSAGLRSQAAPAICPGSVFVKMRYEGAQAGGGLAALDVVRVVVPRGQESAWAKRMEEYPSVLYAEPDYVAYTADVPDDPLWSQQWGPQRLAAADAWNLAVGGPEMIVALLDSGADLAHPDLAGQFWINPGEIPGNGLDDDGNGKVDDVHGWHFYHEIFGGGAYEDAIVQDDAGHGTHVAGIVAASTNNAQGIAGLARGTRLMLVRVVDPAPQACYSDIAAGLIYATDNGARIINLSVGGSADSQMLHDAVRYATGKGVLVIAASGNTGTGGTLYPARYEEVIAVNATDQRENPIGLWGPGEAIDLAAPGKEITSTWLLAQGGYRSETGTSFAAPHVAGVAALVWSLRPDLNAAQVRALLETNADDVNALQYPGRDALVGWGRLNASRAVTAAATDLSLTANVFPTSIPALNGTASLTVTLTNEPGILAGSGAVISFEADGVSVEPAVSLTARGIATATLRAGKIAGMAAITVSLGSLTRTTVLLAMEPPRWELYLPLSFRQ